MLAACSAGQVRPDPRVREHLAHAEAAELARDHAAARRHYQAAVTAALASRRPDEIRLARRELAETLLSWGELAPAAEQLSLLVEAAPGDAGAWHDLGVVRHHLGDDDAAASALARAKALAPDDTRPRVALAALLWRNGKHGDALREYRELLTLTLPPTLRDKVRWAIAQLAPRVDEQSAGAPP